VKARATLAAGTAALLGLLAPPAEGASLAKLEQREEQQLDTLRRDTGTVRFFSRRPRLAHTRAGRRALRYARAELAWTRRELAQTRAERRSHRAAVRPAPRPAVDGCLSTLIDRESGWNVRATNPSTGAYGLPQALPGSKMATAGPDWATNPVTQIRWMRSYVTARYGGSCAALSFQVAHGWY
jgi:hypothetical protein